MRGAAGRGATRPKRGVVVRGMLAWCAWAAANVAVGRALTRSARLTARETELVRRVQARRRPALDRAARIVSTLTDVPATVLHGAVAVAAVHARTRDWRVSGLPALALVLETGTFLAAGALVNRERPAVPRLDHDQPTSSFPSGHQGANVALTLLYARASRSVRSPLLRAAIRCGCVVWPVTVGWSRVHVGMHYPSDVVVGTLNGVTAARLAQRLIG